MQDFSRAAHAVTLLLALGSSGCCGIASYFCGPDKSAWVTRDYRTPEAALATFLEAIRRDHLVTVHECLSEAAKSRYGLLGVVESTIAWQELRKQVPGLHMVGEAEIERRAAEADGRIRFELAVAGRKFQMRLRAQPFWEIAYVAGGEMRRKGRFVEPRALAKAVLIKVDPDTEETVLDVHLDDPLVPPVPLGEVCEVRVGSMWKVDEIAGEGVELGG